MSGYVRVRVPVANLRREPVEAEPLIVRDEIQESQLLFNEVLAVREERGAWLAVDAVEQQRLAGGVWQGYPGWVRKKDVCPSDGPSDIDGVVKAPFTMARLSPADAGPPVFPLSLGTRLSFSDASKRFFGFPLPDGRTAWVPKKDVRPAAEKATAAGVVGLARLFLGTTYLWGGRSMAMPWSAGPVMGVDCSGLVNLVFRAASVDVPRNARDQWAKSVPIEEDELVPGDLVFLSADDREGDVVHVMLFIGGGRLIEAGRTGETVRIRSWPGPGGEATGMHFGRVARQVA